MYSACAAGGTLNFINPQVFLCGWWQGKRGGVTSRNWDGTEPNLTVASMVLKVKDRCKIQAPCQSEFHWLESGTAKQVALATTDFPG
ncbi:hypothetical protein TNCV_4470491 [Trichonephila clavipes]|uniref:Uncharacterized protein n=1 Tax=Trichonephila clavipes TaxID=2585209 RepID=A0A8X6VKI4_TRICX|nr:hypothetical protein TNCV_4470491 [Trichonephila clavipes]